MLVRFTTCVGLQILCEGTEDSIGRIADILVIPDTGAIAGFFVMYAPYPMSDLPFLASSDITSWGSHIHVRDPDAVYPARERVRIAPMLDDPRRVLGQKIQTESGRHLGRCADVQFDTRSMRCTWMFPRRWFRWKTPLPFTSISEVREDAIVVSDDVLIEAEELVDIDVLDTIPEMKDQPM